MADEHTSSDVPIWIDADVAYEHKQILDVERAIAQLQRDPDASRLQQDAIAAGREWVDFHRRRADLISEAIAAQTIPQEVPPPPGWYPERLFTEEPPRHCAVGGPFDGARLETRHFLSVWVARCENGDFVCTTGPDHIDEPPASPDPEVLGRYMWDAEGQQFAWHPLEDRKIP